MAASHGLSEVYLNKGPVLVSQSPAHQKALIEGAPAIIQNEEDRARLQYPAAAEAENIRSMLFVPLRGKGQPLGVVRAYSSRENAFGPEKSGFSRRSRRRGLSRSKTRWRTRRCAGWTSRSRSSRGRSPTS